MGTTPRADYAYAVGRVRALETALVPRAVFREAAAAADAPAALGLIQDAGRFAGSLAEARTGAELEAALALESAAIERLVDELLPDAALREASRLDARDEPGEALALVGPSGSPLLEDYLRLRGDLLNLKAFVRARYLERPAEELAGALRDGGRLAPGFFLDAFALPADEAGRRLAATPYRDLWDEAAAALAERDTFVPLERGVEDLETAALRPARYVVLGPEPVFAYAAARRRQVRTVRLVGVGRLRGVPAAVLRERIGATYA